MSERIFIGVAWPYASGPRHLGHIAGVYLPADIFARYHRTVGNEVLMVSGSDSHGTPITVRAEQEGRTPRQVVEQYHDEFLGYWRDLGISFDLFTTTMTENHARVTQELFLRLLERGFVYKGSMSLPYCPQDRRFLPDRYVEGSCPFCGYPHARGDQCENCGKPLNATDLVEPRCRFCGRTPEVRDSEHYFLKLSTFGERLKEWLAPKAEYWRRPVFTWTQGLLAEGLQDRAITRDIEWGVPVPVEGFADKRIYVWFDAVIGYLSASKEWAQLRGDPEGWRPFWEDPATRSYYFIAKDNIPFHTIIWPAMLMGYGGLNLPYDVPAAQYVTFKGLKASTSRGSAPWVTDYTARIVPDALRYYLAAAMPELTDTEFNPGELVRRNNDELVATWGNLAHRVLTLTYRNFGGAVPDPGALGGADTALLRASEEALAAVGTQLAACRFRTALGQAMALAQRTNRYLDEQAPWKAVKEDRGAAARSLYTALCVINVLKTALYPLLPFSTETLHRSLGYRGELQAAGWKAERLPPGQPLTEPRPLYAKLEPADVLAEEGAA